MTLRRLGLSRAGLLFVVAAVSPIASACSGDASVDFTPVGGSSFGIGATSGNGSGAATSGGTTGNAGSSTTGGATAMGGTGQGANGMGGTSMTAGNAGTNGDAGNAAGGTAGSAGNNMGGTAGSGGDMSGGGTSGTTMGGSAGTGGTGGTGGAGTMGGSSGTGGTMGGSAGTGGTGGGSVCTPSAEICDGIDNNCDNQIDPKGTCPDGCIGALFGGHRYMFCGTVNGISSDVAVCTSANMTTLLIESQAENDFVVSKATGDTWLGGSDAGDEGTWRWVPTNEVFWNKGAVDGEYQNWASMHPNLKFGNLEDCLIIQTGGGAGKWTDIACDSGGKRAACEVAAP